MDPLELSIHGTLAIMPYLVRPGFLEKDKALLMGDEGRERKIKRTPLALFTHKSQPICSTVRQGLKEAQEQAQRGR